MELRELNKNELLNINGGDEPAYGIGYIIGSGLNAINNALGEFFFGDHPWWTTHP